MRDPAAAEQAVRAALSQRGIGIKQLAVTEPSMEDVFVAMIEQEECKPRMNLRRTRAVARKEFWHVLRDTRSLILALAMPMILLLLFGYALSLDVDQIPTAVVDQDRTPQSRDLLERFAASRYFKLVDYPGACPRRRAAHPAGTRWCWVL